MTFEKKITFFEMIRVDSVSRCLNALIQFEVNHVVDPVDLGLDDLPRRSDELLRTLRLTARDLSSAAFGFFAISHTSVHFRFK